jgi:hypothetical protein
MLSACRLQLVFVPWRQRFTAGMALGLPSILDARGSGQLCLLQHMWL